MARPRERLSDIAISTIDAFCLSLLREFPLEADVDPGFALADDTEIPRLIEEALDRALRISPRASRAKTTMSRSCLPSSASGGCARVSTTLLDRRLVAPDILRRFLQKGPRDLTAARACHNAADRLQRLFAGVPGGLDPFLNDGPLHRPAFAMLAAEIRGVAGPRGPALPADEVSLSPPARSRRRFEGLSIGCAATSSRSKVSRARRVSRAPGSTLTIAPPRRRGSGIAIAPRIWRPRSPKPCEPFGGISTS